MSASPQNMTNLIRFSRTAPDDHPPTLPPCRWPAPITLLTPTTFQLVGRHLRYAFFARAAPWSARSVLHEDRIGRNVKYVRRFCDHIHVLHICDRTCIVSKLGWRCTTGRLIFGPPPLYPSHPPTPPPSRWPALSTLPLLARFMLA